MQRTLSDEEDAYVDQNRKEERQEQNSDMCLRCEQEKPGRFCSLCSKGYCMNCKEYRGKEIAGEFKCFECQVMRNNLSEEREVVKEPYECDSRNYNRYVPQLGDEVYFFFQGY